MEAVQKGPARASRTGERLVWASICLALLVSIGYLLIARQRLGVGSLKLEPGSEVIPYVAATGYLVGGLLIPLRRRWLWIAGAVINALVMWMFFSMHSAEPDVLLSAGGLSTKILQAALEIALIALIVTEWRAAPAPKRAAAAGGGANPGPGGPPAPRAV